MKKSKETTKIEFSEPIFEEGEIARGPDGRFTTIEENNTAEHIERSSTSTPEEDNPTPGETTRTLEETVLGAIFDMKTTTASPGIGEETRNCYVTGQPRARNTTT